MPATAPTGPDEPPAEGVVPAPVVAWPSPDGVAPPVEAETRPAPHAGSIAMVVGAVTLFALSDVFSKQLSASLPPLQIAWLRFGVLLAIALLLVVRRKRSLVPLRPVSQLARGVMLLGAGVFFIMALPWLGVAEATAISFVTPLFITLLAIPLLGEVVGRRRWTALLLGLAGVLIVVRPGADAFQLAALFPFASALCGAVMAVITRRIGASDASETTLAWSAAIGFALLTLSAPLWWTGVGAALAAPALLMGALYGTGQYLLVMAYSRGDASLVAPFSYVQVAIASALGAIVFDRLPDAVSLGGILLVVASGAYTLYREGVLPKWRRWPAAFRPPRRKATKET